MILATLAALAVVSSSVLRPEELKVMSYNLRYATADDKANAWPLRREMMFDLLRREKADVIGIQEALHSQIVELKAALPGYFHVGVGRDDGKAAGEYSAILYDSSKIKVEASGTFWLSDTPSVVNSNTWKAACTRICTWARFSTKSGKTFTMFNVHLDHVSQMAREKSVELVAQRIYDRKPKDLVVLTGDFNAGETNYAVASVRTLTGLEDTFRRRHPADKEVGTFTGFEFGKIGGEKIDYVFASPVFDVKDAKILRDSKDGRYPSDHFPVMAKLAFPVD